MHKFLFYQQISDLSINEWQNLSYKNYFLVEIWEQCLISIRDDRFMIIVWKLNFSVSTMQFQISTVQLLKYVLTNPYRQWGDETL